MIFNSVTYLLFLAIVVLLYWQLPRGPRLWMLFLASLTFYGFWRVEFLPVMLASTVVDYLAARGIAGSVSPESLRIRNIASWRGPATRASRRGPVRSVTGMSK